jgi:hypothetical protein
MSEISYINNEGKEPSGDRPFRPDHREHTRDGKD